MKRLFKTSAIFACLALLLGACDREPVDGTTEYSGVPIVPTSDITVLKPGNGKFEIEWEINDNDNITGCELYWSNGLGTSGTQVFTAEDDGVAPRATLTYLVEDLPSGSFTVSLTNTSDIDIYTVAVSKSVSVYDDSSYTESVVVSEVIHTGVNAEIDWEGEAPDDCVGVFVTYTKDGEEVISSLLPAEGTAVLEGADEGSTFTYVTCYQPEIAVADDYVQIATPDEDGTVDDDGVIVPLETDIPSASPEAPVSLSVLPGDCFIRVTWDITSLDYLAETVISYTSTDGSVSGSKTYTTVELGSNTYDLTGLSKDYTYTVSVRNSTSSGDVSRAAEVENVEIYDYGYYISSCTAPTIVMTTTVNDSGKTVISVKVTDVSLITCTDVSITYRYGKSTSQYATVSITDFSEPTIISNGYSGGDYSYSATFALPEGALNDEYVYTTSLDSNGKTLTLPVTD